MACAPWIQFVRRRLAAFSSFFGSIEAMARADAVDFEPRSIELRVAQANISSELASHVKRQPCHSGQTVGYT